MRRLQSILVTLIITFAFAKADEESGVCTRNNLPRCNVGHDVFREWDADAPQEDVIVDITCVDPEKHFLKYSWEFASVPTGSMVQKTSSIENQKTTTVSFKPDLKGTYKLKVTVKDPCNEISETIRVYLMSNPTEITRDEECAGNRPPFVRLQDDFLVDLAELRGDGINIALDGVYDIDDDELVKASWRLLKSPEGSRSTVIPDTPLKNAVLFADRPGLYLVKFKVWDMCEWTSDTVKIVVADSSGDATGNGKNIGHGNDDNVEEMDADRCVGNAPPVANAGRDQTVKFDIDSGDFYVAGSAINSFDPDGTGIAYWWSFISTPLHSYLTDRNIEGRNAPYMSFAPDRKGLYQVKLTVSDGCEERVDQVRFFVDDIPTCYNCYPRVNCTTNQPPVAHAGPDQVLVVNLRYPHTVSLDGDMSYDRDGDSLLYHWTLSKVPSGSKLGRGDEDFHHPHYKKTSFIPDVEGTFEVQIEISDGCSSVRDQLILYVKDDPYLATHSHKYTGNCCLPGTGNSCGDAQVAACVCEVESFCCKPQGIWDEWCAKIASDNCGGCHRHLPEPADEDNDHVEADLLASSRGPRFYNADRRQKYQSCIDQANASMDFAFAEVNCMQKLRATDLGVPEDGPQLGMRSICLVILVVGSVTVSATYQWLKRRQRARDSQLLVR